MSGQRDAFQLDCFACMYPQVSDEFCLAGRWTQVDSQIAPQSKDREVAARHTNQIRAFYEASAAALWITFHAGLHVVVLCEPNGLTARGRCEGADRDRWVASDGAPVMRYLRQHRD